VDKCKGGYEDVLVITDHFTRYAKAIPCRNQKANTTAKALFEHFIAHYSFPEQLHSDQGRNFESQVIKELCKLANVQKTRTTPFHPMGNASAERFNRTLLRMLGTLCDEKKANWKDYISSLVQAYNATKSSSTGYSPHFLMFGWHPRLPVDAYLGTTPSNEGEALHSSYVTKLQERLKFAYKIASDCAQKRAAQNKTLYDRRVKENQICTDDLVLVRQVNLQGRHKLADKWEKEPYVVLEIPYEGQPVYRVQRETRKGPIRTLHRNMLLPFVSIPEQVEVPQIVRKVKPRTKPSQRSESDSDSDSSSNSDSQVQLYIIPQRRSQNISTVNTVTPVSNISTPVSSSPSQSHSSPDPVPLNRSPSPAPISVTEGPATASPSSTSSSFHVPSVNTSPSSQSGQNNLPPSRPMRQRRPPDRYGDWQFQQSASVEFFV
jgi:hypothetical protein